MRMYLKERFIRHLTALKRSGLAHGYNLLDSMFCLVSPLCILLYERFKKVDDAPVLAT